MTGSGTEAISYFAIYVFGGLVLGFIGATIILLTKWLRNQ